MKALVAVTQPLIIVTFAPTRTISTSFVAKASEWVHTGRALLFRAIRPAVARVANAAVDLPRIPRLCVCATSTLREDFHRQALAATAAFVKASVSLTGHAFEWWPANTFSTAIN